MVDAIKNFAYSTVATAPSPATSGTSLVVATGQGSYFPAAPFDATIWPSGTQPSNTNAEIVRVTAVTTDTFTITRAQYGTSAQSITAGYQIAQTVDANLIGQLVPVVNGALTGPIENVSVTSTAVSGAMTLTVSGGANTVNLYTTNASGNFSFNIAGPGTLLATGQAVSVAALTNQGSTAYYCTAVTIDGTSSGVTLWWQGGTAPTAGNASGIDSYVFTVIKTGSGAYTVLAALTQF
jgi:hypothetical protein